MELRKITDEQKGLLVKNKNKDPNRNSEVGPAQYTTLVTKLEDVTGSLMSGSSELEKDVAAAIARKAD